MMTHRTGGPAALLRPAARRSRMSSAQRWRLATSCPCRCAATVSTIMGVQLQLFAAATRWCSSRSAERVVRKTAWVSAGRWAADAWHGHAAGRPHRSRRRRSCHAGVLTQAWGCLIANQEAMTETAVQKWGSVAEISILHPPACLLEGHVLHVCMPHQLQCCHFSQLL